jgi:hypothetical protein
MTGKLCHAARAARGGIPSASVPGWATEHGGHGRDRRRANLLPC